MLAVNLILVILLAGNEVNAYSIGSFARQYSVYQQGNQDVNQEENQDEVGEEFDICPDHHPWAFDNGAQCCKERDADSENRAQVRCDDAEPCHSSFCENNHSPCITVDKNNVISLTGFNEETVDGHYFFNYSDAAFESNEPIFRRQDSVASCIWWHRPYRHWWVGSCDNIGQNAGYAYIKPDLQCPVTSGKPYWRRGGSDELLQGADASFALFLTASAGSPTTDHTSSIGLNAILRNGRYRQTCRFRRVAEQWRCI